MEQLIVPLSLVIGFIVGYLVKKSTYVININFKENKQEEI